MTFRAWLWVIWETVLPTTLSWVTIFLPAIVFGVVAWVMRRRQGEVKGAWRTVGRRLRALGLTMGGVAVMAWLLVAVMSSRYDSDYRNSLKHRAESIRMGQNQWELIDDLANRADEDTTRMILKDFASARGDEERTRSIQAWLKSHFNQNIIDFYGDLNWPQERIEKFRQDNQGRSPGTLLENLQFDVNQMKLLEDDKFDELHASLRPEQWKFLLDHYLDPLEHADLISVLESVVQSSPSREALSQIEEQLYDAVFSDTGQADRLVWMFDSPSLSPVLRFLWEHVRWVREALWLVAYLITSVLLVSRGKRYFREGKSNLFRVDTRAAVQNSAGRRMR